MASVLFSTIGQAVGGPLAAAIGATVGGAVDSALLGGRRRSASDLFVQRSAYGDPLPRLYGRTRVAGQLIWALPLDGSRGKGRGRRTAGSSFAIALASGPIQDVRRVWADGREIRNSAGAFERPTVMRVHRGVREQPADPLIAAAEGMDTAPSYAGIAYVVFEDFDLSSFGNRIPNLSFEVIGSEDGADSWLRAEAERGNVPVQEGAGDPSSIGYAALDRGTDECARLLRLSNFSLRFVDGAAQFSGSTRIFEIELTELLSNDRESLELTQGNRPRSMGIGYMDADRDYQLGRQRATRSRRGLELENEAAVTASAGGARMLAARLLRQSEAATDRISFSLSWRWLGLAVGDLVSLKGDNWRIVERDVRGLLVSYLAERAWGEEAWPATPSDPGRNLPSPMLPSEPTDVQLFEAPVPLVSGRKSAWLWMGGGAGWRGATASQLVAGEEQEIGGIRQPMSWGRLKAPVEVGPETVWDRRSILLVEVDDGVPAFESRSEAEVLAGANLVRIGSELLQFCNADPVGGNLIRLSGLLRGQFGTGFRMRTVGAGEIVRLMPPGRLLPIDLPMDASDRSLLVLANGRGDPIGGTEASLIVEGLASSRMAPVHLQVSANADGSLSSRWIQRASAFWFWTSDEPASVDYRWWFEAADGRKVSRFVSGLELEISVEEQVMLLGEPFRTGRVFVESVGEGPLDLRTSTSIQI